MIFGARRLQENIVINHTDHYAFLHSGNKTISNVLLTLLMRKKACLENTTIQNC